MDRNREARRASILGSNGFNRRRHRTNSLRDSPDEDGGVELQESVRLRERVKKDHRDRDRERERERERERSSRSKRRRAERLMGNRDDLADDSSDESVNDEDDDEDEERATTTAPAASTTNGNGGGSRLLPPSHTAMGSTPYQHHHQSNHHHINNSQSQPYSSNGHSNSGSHHHHHHHLQHRKTFPPNSSSSSKVLRTAPAWKPGDEMIGVSVPRKARSASTKRSHDWISNSTGGGVAGGEPASLSPARQVLVSTATPSPAAPMSKKLKPSCNSTGPKLKPAKASSKSISSNPEELEIEIAEVLYGLSHQSQVPSSNKEDSREANRSISDTKSRVSSPISNSTSGNNPVLPPNPGPLSTVAPKRKKPRQVLENIGHGVRNGTISAKVEIDQTLKGEISSPKMEKISGSPDENASEMGTLVNSQGLRERTPQAPATKVDSDLKPMAEEFKENRDMVAKEEVNSSGKEEDHIKNDKENTPDNPIAMKMSCMVSEVQNQRDKKFEIDLMVPPSQGRSSPERGSKADLSEKKPVLASFDAEKEDKEDEKMKIAKENLGNVLGEEERSKGKAEETELQKGVANKGRNFDLQLDLGKSERESGGLNATDCNKLQHGQNQHQHQVPVKPNREAGHADKSGQLTSSLPLPMSMPGWPGGLPPMGYMAPFQGVVSMDSSTTAPAPIQPPFSHPRPKRCATHSYIARNIHYLQQLMKMNPFWPAAAGSASLFGTKPGNANGLPAMDLHGNPAMRGLNSTQDKGQGLVHSSSLGGKDKGGLASNNSDSAQRKQQILLQQPLPPVPPSNLLGPAFIFPLNQQQVAMAAASARPKPPNTTGGVPSSATTSSSVVVSGSSSAGAPAGMTFSYPNIPANETPYLAILNNGYPFPIPAMGAPPNYRGTSAQAMPLFNGSFYPSQIIHPSQLHQQQQPVASQSQQMQQVNQNTSMSNASSSLKHLQSQQPRPQGNNVNGESASGNLQNFTAQKSQPSQVSRAWQLENELHGEDSPSTADSRGSWASMSIHRQNFSVPFHPQNFALMTPAALASASAATPTSGSVSHSEKQQQQPQQVMLKTGLDSVPSHTFAMSFGPVNVTSSSGPGIDVTSMPNAIFQSFPEAARQNFQMMAAAAVAQVSQKKNFRISDDGKSGGGDFSATDDDRKAAAGKSLSVAGQSIAFARSEADLSSSSAQVGSVIDSSTRSLNLASGPAHNSRPAAANNSSAVNVPSAHIQSQIQHHQQHQQLLQLHKHQQQQLAATLGARSKASESSNSIIYSEHLNSSSSIAGKFPNALPGFPQNFVQSSSSSSASQSPQWKNAVRATTSQAPSSLALSTTSSVKSLPQQQSRVQQMHTQISFGGNQKPPAPQGQPTPCSNQTPSSPMMVGSPTTSISKGGSGSPRTTASASASNKSGQASSISLQQAKNPPSVPGQKPPSILGPPHIVSSTSSGSKNQMQQQSQQQQLVKSMQQGQMFFSNSYSQNQSPHPTNMSSTNSSTSAYYLQRKRADQHQQPSNVPASSSTKMVSLNPPVTLAVTNTGDPAKAIAAATNNSKGSGLPTQGIMTAVQFAGQSSGSLLPAGFSYITVPAAVQVKPAEQKQPAA